MSINNIDGAAKSSSCFVSLSTFRSEKRLRKKLNGRKTKPLKKNEPKTTWKKSNSQRREFLRLQLSFHHAAVSQRRVSLSRFDQVLSKLIVLQFKEIYWRHFCAIRNSWTIQLINNIKSAIKLWTSCGLKCCLAFVDILLKFRLQSNKNIYKLLYCTILGFSLRSERK